MFKKVVTTLAATMAVASAQSWSDAAGLCSSFYGDKKNGALANQWYPAKDLIRLDDPSLHEMVLEFDDKPKSRSKPADLSIKCFYFITQGDEEEREESERWCVDAAARKKALSSKPYPKQEKIPLWNVKRIETNVVEENGIVDMTFKMRYTNFSTSTGYYTDDDKVLTQDSIKDKIDAGELPPGSDTDFDLKTIIANKHPEALTWNSVDGWVWQTPAWSDVTSGAFLQKYLDYSMVKYNDTISVKFYQASEDAEIKQGCSIEIMKGSTIKAAKFNADEGERSFFMNSIQFRLQPIKEYYDTIHKYSQNGDTYSVGYDDDYMDGKIEYTANGYPSQSFKWKLSRSNSKTIVATVLTMAGALIGSWAI